MFSLEKKQKFYSSSIDYFIKGGAWWIFGQAGIMIISFLTLLAFSHLLPKEVFGAYQYIISMTSIFGIAALPGMGTAIIRAVAQKKEGTLYPAIILSLKWSSIGVFTCLFVALWYFLHHNFILGASLIIASFLFPIPRITNLSFNFWQGRKRFDLNAKYALIINALEAAIFIPVLFLTKNLILIILTYFFSRSLFRALFLKFTLGKIENQEKDKNTLNFGKHLTLIQAIFIFSDQLDRIIAWHFLGPVAVAVYSFAKITLQKIQSLIPIAPLALPKLSEKNIKEIKKRVFKIFLKLFLLSFPLFLVVFFLAPVFYKLLFPKYLESINYFRALSLVLLLSPFSLIRVSFIAEMKKRDLYIISLLIPLIKIVLFFILVPLYQIWGIVYTVLLTRLLSSLSLLYFFKKM